MTGNVEGEHNAELFGVISNKWGGLSLELKEDSMKSSVGKIITFRCYKAEKRLWVGDEWRRTEKWRQATCNMTGIEGEHNANTEGLSDSLNSL